MKKYRQYLVILAGLWIALFFAQNVHALTPTEAGQKGIDWMVPDTITWQNNHGCIGCHVQAETIWGLSIGKSRGYTIDTAKLSTLVTKMKEWQCPNDGSWYYYPGCTYYWHNETTVFTASALAFYDRMVATDAQGNLLKAAAYLKSVQLSAGNWSIVTNYTPIMNGPGYWGTTMGLITVKRAYDLTSDAAYKTSYESAVNWLKATSPTMVQDNAFVLIGLIEGGVANTDTSVTTAKNRLLALRNADGGWGSSAGQPSNPYNTGQAVYSLRLAGMLLQDTAIDAGIKWLVANQNSAGYWSPGTSGVGTLFSSTMWPVIALGQFGSLGVEVSADPLKQQVLAGKPDPQTVDYLITVKNTGSQIADDTYDVTVTGTMEGWSASLSQSSITLVPNTSGTLALAVTAPPMLPDGMPVMLTITAVSRTSKDVTGSVMVTTYTPPEPPVTGHKTTITLVSGNNTVMSQCDTVVLSAKVVDQATGATLTGPGIGAVNFLVAGIAVGSSTDADGQGVFTTTWTPGGDWTKLNAQSILAVYSGFDLPSTNEDLLSSNVVGSIIINPGVCNHPPVAAAGPAQTVECAGSQGASVTLDGSASSDPDNDKLTYTWTWQGGSASGVNPAVTLPLGSTTVVLVVDDGKGGTSQAEVVITVRDTVPPVTIVRSIVGTAGANGWYTSSVTVNLEATDQCSGVKEVRTTLDGTEAIVPGSAASIVAAAEGTHTLSYAATDNAGNAEAVHSGSLNIDATPPAITASVSPAPNAQGWNNTDVTVTFLCSDTLSGVAYCPAPVTVSAEGAGQIITGVSTDNAGLTASASVVLNIDKTAPTLSVTVNPAILWPPNHKMVRITAAVSAQDNLDNALTAKLLSITSNEPDNGKADGNTLNDIVINSDGTFSLRAERSAKGNGRVYTIVYQATDAAGNSSTATATVTVPHDLGKPCDDDDKHGDCDSDCEKRDDSHESNKGHDKDHDKDHERDKERDKGSDKEHSAKLKK